MTVENNARDDSTGGEINSAGLVSWNAEQIAIRALLDQLADWLSAHGDLTMTMWRERIENDALMTATSHWSRRQFEDHLPETVLSLCAKLRAWPQSGGDEQAQREHEAAEAHSQHRWQQGYDLRSLTRELGHFNACLIEAFEQFETERIAAADAVEERMTIRAAMRNARRTTAQLILESTSDSVAEYARLLQSEAATRGREMEGALAHLQEMERSRGTMLREAAHDLRGSLGIVTGSASLIERGSLAPDDEAEMHRILQRGVSSLQQMMTDLMDLSRLEAGQEKCESAPFDAAQVLRDLCETSRPLAEARGLDLRYDGPELLPVEGDMGKVRRIAQNLILNALKYTHRGGIVIEWALHPNDCWLLRVQDSGPGFSMSTAPIAREIQSATDSAREIDGQTAGESNPHLSPADSASASPEANETAAATESSLSGEGIGLSIVKRLCDLLDASLELDSEAGKGSTFHVLFRQHN